MRQVDLSCLPVAYEGNRSTLEASVYYQTSSTLQGAICPHAVIDSSAVYVDSAPDVNCEIKTLRR